MKRLLVNDALSQLGEVTFWHRLANWFDCQPVTAPFASLAEAAELVDAPTLIIRNASYFRPLKTECPQISLLQDIMADGPQREMQTAVIESSASVVYNSDFTASKYEPERKDRIVQFKRIIPLPVDFSTFTIQNSMGCQQALALPDGCVCWIGACQGAAGQVKGWDIFTQIVRLNPDIPFVAVLKDGAPQAVPPNLRYYVRLTHAELVRVIGACRVGLCTSRTESQHLAGIEMGACGLPMVAPTVGVYWKRDNLPGVQVIDPTVEYYTSAVRAMLSEPRSAEGIRGYWQREFDVPVIRSQWESLVKEVECSGQS